MKSLIWRIVQTDKRDLNDVLEWYLVDILEYTFLLDYSLISEWQQNQAMKNQNKGRK